MTLPSAIRIVGRGTIAYTDGPDCPTWALVNYQAPDFLMDALEPLFRRMTESYQRAPVR
jgi:hypothetical protein